MKKEVQRESLFFISVIEKGGLTFTKGFRRQKNYLLLKIEPRIINSLHFSSKRFIYTLCFVFLVNTFHVFQRVYYFRFGKERRRNQLKPRNYFLLDLFLEKSCWCFSKCLRRSLMFETKLPGVSVCISRSQRVPAKVLVKTSTRILLNKGNRKWVPPKTLLDTLVNVLSRIWRGTSLRPLYSKPT